MAKKIKKGVVSGIIEIMAIIRRIMAAWRWHNEIMAKCGGMAAGEKAKYRQIMKKRNGIIGHQA